MKLQQYLVGEIARQQCPKQGQSPIEGREYFELLFPKDSVCRMMFAET